MTYEVLEPEPPAKRSRLDAPVEQNWGTAPTSPTFNTTPTYTSQLTESSPLDCVPTFSAAVEDTSTICSNAPLTALPVIDRWNCALSQCVETNSSRQTVLPPLDAFVGAHSCTYYLWFATRASLFSRVGDPQSCHGRTALATEQWQLKLYNEQEKRYYNFNEKIFDTGAVRCACGMPPLLPKIVFKLPHRADESPIQSIDFDSPAIQAIICTDLELAHAKLQFEQTDEILLNMSSWSAQQWTERSYARDTIIRNSWDPSFTAVPLETPDIIARRPWIIRFRDLLQDWPNFDLSGSFPAAEDPGYLESLASFEQRMIAFYLESVSSTLGIRPARPRHRPDIDALPELYRNIFS
ncbi:hypothetical protein B0H19DRAFT_1191082 [Mycena capillaripes]|nr:hypothetical protein B0H19DRAFT_1191082 [Mycena capillaripes]